MDYVVIIDRDGKTLIKGEGLRAKVGQKVMPTEEVIALARKSPELFEEFHMYGPTELDKAGNAIAKRFAVLPFEWMNEEETQVAEAALQHPEIQTAMFGFVRGEHWYPLTGTMVRKEGEKLMDIVAAKEAGLKVNKAK